MKLLAFFVPLPFLPGIAASEEDRNVIEVSSPDGKYTLRFEREQPNHYYRASLLNKEKSELYSSMMDGCVDDQSIVWNESSTAVAFSEGIPSMMNASILFVSDKDCSLVEAPSPQQGWDNIYQIPQSWKGDLLLMKVNGPHAGKAYGYWFCGEMTIQANCPERSLKKISEEIDVVSDYCPEEYNISYFDGKEDETKTPPADPAEAVPPPETGKAESASSQPGKDEPDKSPTPTPAPAPIQTPPPSPGQ